MICSIHLEMFWFTYSLCVLSPAIHNLWRKYTIYSVTLSYRHTLMSSKWYYYTPLYILYNTVLYITIHVYIEHDSCLRTCVVPLVYNYTFVHECVYTFRRNNFHIDSYRKKYTCMYWPKFLWLYRGLTKPNIQQQITSILSARMFQEYLVSVSLD